MVGHTHDDIDASFGGWSMKLHEEDFLTIPFLMKLYKDLDNVLVIPHLIEEVLVLRCLSNHSFSKEVTT